MPDNELWGKMYCIFSVSIRLFLHSLVISHSLCIVNSRPVVGDDMLAVFTTPSTAPFSLNDSRAKKETTFTSTAEAEPDKIKLSSEGCQV